MGTFERHFANYIRDFRNSAKVVARSPTGKGVHQLRVLSRRLRAVLWMAKFYDGADILPRLKTNLRSLGKNLGHGRQLDVLMKDASLYVLSDVDLKKQRKAWSREFKAFLTPDLCGEITRDLRELYKGVKASTSVEREVVLRKIYKPICKWPKKMPKDKGFLHQVRIEAKKVIYRLELLETEASSLKELQKSLGRVHDLEELQKIFTSREAAQDMKVMKKKGRKIYDRARNEFNA
ncbi:CHAD domain protein [compost metagenome]